jgi:hypothetical protein
MENMVSFYMIVSWVKDAFHPKSEAIFPSFNRRGVGRSHYPCGVASVVPVVTTATTLAPGMDSKPAQLRNLGSIQLYAITLPGFWLFCSRWGTRQRQPQTTGDRAGAAAIPAAAGATNSAQ